MAKAFKRTNRWREVKQAKISLARWDALATMSFM